MQIRQEQESQKRELQELQNLSRIVRSQRSDLKRAHERLDVISEELQAHKTVEHSHIPVYQQEVLALKDTVADIQNRVKTIEGKSGSTSTGSSQLKGEINSINDKLTKIQQIQKTQDSGTPATSKVFQDPYNILRNLK